MLAAEQQKPKSGSEFFSTLQWQDESENLMEGDSDEDEGPVKQDSFEEGFSSLSNQRASNQVNGEKPRTESPWGNEKPSNATENAFETNFGNEKPSENTAELLNFGTSPPGSKVTSEVTAGVDLLDIGNDTPTNFDLLNTAAVPSSNLSSKHSSANDLLSDAFDPFESSQPANAQPAKSSNLFDPFDSGSGQPSSQKTFDPFQSATSESKPTESAKKGGQDDFLAFMESSDPVPNKGKLNCLFICS